MACVGSLGILLAGTVPAWSQYVVSARAGTINYIRGQVSVDGQALQRSPTSFPMLHEGQVLGTGAGRAEILLGPGVFLRLAEHGTLLMLSTRLDDAQVEVQQGTALVEVVDIVKDSDVHILLGRTRTGFKGMGLHRFAADSNELRVFGGHAEVFAGDQKVEAGRGRLVHLGDTLAVSRFDPRQRDGLLQWAARRSFFLFRSNATAHQHQSNWEVRRVTPGSDRAGLPTDQDLTYVSNRDFGVVFSAKAR